MTMVSTAIMISFFILEFRMSSLAACTTMRLDEGTEPIRYATDPISGFTRLFLGTRVMMGPVATLDSRDGKFDGQKILVIHGASFQLEDLHMNEDGSDIAFIRDGKVDVSGD